jgi:uncharacterized membrane protein
MPHPRHLREYEDILPGVAERMMQMAEKAQNHNAAMDRKIIDGEHDDRRRGMLFGFSALLLMLALAGLFGYLGHAEISAMFLGSAAFGVIAVFVQGRFGKE